tara:strand:+ start:204 stop:1076 length:873 start_codon:yes stop_codon:yes gene_type:complete
MQNNNKNERSYITLQVSLKIEEKIGELVVAMKDKYGIDKGQQLSLVISEYLKSESDLEKLIVKGLLVEHESKGNLLRDMAKNLGISDSSSTNATLNVANEIATRMIPVVSANVVDVFSKKKSTKTSKTKNIINKCLESNSEVNTTMKSQFEAISDNQVVDTEVGQIDWASYGGKRYDDLDLIGMSLKDASVLSEHNLFGGFMNGYFATLHSQALALWQDEEKQLSLRQIARLQPHIDQVTGMSKVLTIQTIAKRIFKAIVHFGTAEEKQLLFGDSTICPRPNARKQKAQS